jgi:hypothetical protein
MYNCSWLVMPPSFDVLQYNRGRVLAADTDENFQSNLPRIHGAHFFGLIELFMAV